MNRTILLTSILFVITNILYSQQISHSVYFANDKYTISAQEQEKLNNFTRKISKLDIKKIKLSGHTDYNHSNEYNEVLSQNRANYVSKYLQSQSIDKLLINSKYSGEISPIKTNETDEGRAKNRRVEIVAFCKAKMLSIAEIQSIRNRLVPAQVFEIDPTKDNLLHGKDSTLIVLPKNIFVTEMGEQVNGKVKVRLHEYIKKADIFMGGMNTSSDGLMLESGGTIKISAVDSKNLKLRIKNSKSFSILFPNKKAKKDMQFFNGNRQSNGNMNWTVSSSGSVSQFVRSSVVVLPKPYRLKLFKSFDDNEKLTNFEKFTNNFRGHGHKIDPKKYHYKVKDTLFLSSYFEDMLDRRQKKNASKIRVNNYNDSLYAELMKSWADNQNVNSEIFQKLYNTTDTRVIKQIMNKNRNYYVLNSLQLTTINCDRFTSIRQKVTQIINIKPSLDVQTSIVFKGMRSMMSAIGLNKYYYIHNLPKNKKASLFVVKYFDDYALVGTKSIRVSKNPVNDIGFKKIKYSALRQYLNGLFI